MEFYRYLILFICIFSSCSIRSENTFEENFALCKKRPNANQDTIKHPRLYADYDCMKGSLGPVFTAMTNRGDNINTKPSHGKAMILYFWSTDKSAPVDFVRSDSADAAAMNILYHKFYKQADFIGFPFNDSNTVNQYLKEHPLDFPQVIDKTTTDKEHYITQYTHPLVIFINNKGRVVDIYSGSLRRKELIIEKYTPVIQACLPNSINAN